MNLVLSKVDLLVTLAAQYSRYERLNILVHEIERIPHISTALSAIMRKFHRIYFFCFSEIRVVEGVTFLVVSHAELEHCR